jgi:hypothetical protein
VSRIGPGRVPDPPTDIVAFFAEAGVDIAGRTDRAVAETGPIRDLRRRVALARELAAVAHVPSIDRSRTPFVERAAEAGGLSPEEGVLTPRWPGASSTARPNVRRAGSGPDGVGEYPQGRAARRKPVR